MGPEAILYPSIAMFFLSWGMIGRLGIRRYRATAAREVDVRYYRDFAGDGEPADLRVLTRHVNNQFEVPPLFHIAVLMNFAAGVVTPLAVGLAWAFFASRVLHSVIHLGRNDVQKRFFTYGAGLLLLGGLWLHLLLRITF